MYVNVGQHYYSPLSSLWRPQWRLIRTRHNYPVSFEESPIIAMKENLVELPVFNVKRLVLSYARVVKPR